MFQRDRSGRVHSRFVTPQHQLLEVATSQLEADHPNGLRSEVATGRNVECAVPRACRLRAWSHYASAPSWYHGLAPPFV